MSDDGRRLPPQDEQSVIQVLRAMGVSQDEMAETLQEIVAAHPELKEIVQAIDPEAGVTSEALLGAIAEALGENIDQLPEDMRRKILEQRKAKGEPSKAREAQETSESSDVEMPEDNVIPLRGRPQDRQDPDPKPPTPRPF